MIKRFFNRGQDESPLDSEQAERKHGLLRASDLFSELDEAQMADVDRMTVMTTCQRGRLVYTPGETGEALFLLKQGKVNIYRITPEGKKLVTAVIPPGTMFGHMEFTGSSLSDSYAEAQEDSLLCVMSRHDIEELVIRYPSIGLRLLDHMSRRMTELEARLEQGLLRDMSARVAAALLRLADAQGGNNIRTTHQEIADSLGTYRETVTNTLGQFQNEGVVSLERGRILISDPETLRNIVDAGSD
jgi:CRP/FNR family cyclic AMP-dependent transcriptional regulator